MNASEDLTGRRVGHLTVEGVSFIAIGGNEYWRCRCDCGKTVVLNGWILRNGERKYCGKSCSARSKPLPSKSCSAQSEIRRKKHRVRCGREHKNFRHGGRSRQSENCACRLYTIWRNMKCRCLNRQHPAYSRYGGRGISVCDEWLNFTEFQRWALSSGYTDEMTIDRIDVDKGYEPGNCQWMTKSEHAKKTNSERKHRNN